MGFLWFISLTRRFMVWQKKYFNKMSPETAHNAMVEVLKKRRDTLRIVDFINEVPNSLKAASLSIRLTKEERTRFLNILNNDIMSAFV